LRKKCPVGGAKGGGDSRWYPPPKLGNSFSREEKILEDQKEINDGYPVVVFFRLWGVKRRKGGERPETQKGEQTRPGSGRDGVFCLREVGCGSPEKGCKGHEPPRGDGGGRTRIGGDEGTEDIKAECPSIDKPNGKGPILLLWTLVAE